MDAKLIGLSGMAGAGKDFSFDTLVNHFPNKLIKRIALADGVRQEIEDIVGAGAGDELPAVWSKPYPPEIRWLLQQWGTELRRSQDPDYWVKYAFKTIEDWGDTVRSVNGQYKTELLKHPDVWVFTDVRFDNEAQGVRDRGGIIVEVTAPSSVRARRLGGRLPPNHASEEIDFTPDAFIINDRDDGPPHIGTFIKEYLAT